MDVLCVVWIPIYNHLYMLYTCAYKKCYLIVFQHVHYIFMWECMRVYVCMCLRSCVFLFRAHFYLSSSSSLSLSFLFLTFIFSVSDISIALYSSICIYTLYNQFNTCMHVKWWYTFYTLNFSSSFKHFPLSTDFTTIKNIIYL